jgi:hypothetical protein
MNWGYDDRGSVVEPEISMAEIRRRKWNGKRSREIPLIWRDAVAKTIEQDRIEQERRELAARLNPAPTAALAPQHQFNWQRRC